MRPYLLIAIAMNRPFICFLALLLFLTTSLMAQDVLYSKTGHTLNCEIIKIDQDTIHLIARGQETVAPLQKLNSFLYKGKLFDLQSASVQEIMMELEVYKKSSQVDNPLKTAMRQYPAFWVNRNRQIIPAERIEFKDPLIGRNKLYIDGNRLDSDEVLFYGEYNQVYANESLIGSRAQHRYLELVKVGKINIFEKEVADYAHSAPTMGPNGQMMGGGTMYMGRRKVKYFNQGLGPIQPVKSINLLSVMEDDPEALGHLKKYRSNNTLTILINTLGAGVMLASFLSDTGASSNGGTPSQGESVDVKIPAGVIIGAGMIGLGWTFQIGNSKNIDRAVDTYNAGY
ncbi:hypothetical protein PEDI_11450 [Persicobacter diffluens]|uniref:Uncharacterized protein n=2 Tax=Persicobacter diffluens TaxID=981 RepID=A0AAN4VVS4_9BACT|nr:hypothetical protein PEDI_11450 [Persicobacter diffluens]